MFQLDFADPPEGITAQLVETQRRGVKKNVEKSPTFVIELTSELLLLLLLLGSALT